MAKKYTKQKPLLFIEILCIALIIFFIALFVKIQHRFNQPYFTQTYSGMFPCADCSGIETTLTITTQKTHATDGTYVMQQIYQVKNVQPFITSGNWIIIHSNHQTILELSPDKPADLTYFLMVNPSTLQILDKDKHIISAPFPMSLYLRK